MCVFFLVSRKKCLDASVNVKALTSEQIHSLPTTCIGICWYDNGACFIHKLCLLMSPINLYKGGQHESQLVQTLAPLYLDIFDISLPAHRHTHIFFFACL